MRVELDIHFTGLMVKPFKIVKYDCNRYSVKAILEHYGCCCADYILGKQLGFYFDGNTRAIFPWHISMFQELELCHGICMVKQTAIETKDVLDIAKTKLKLGEPTLLYGWTDSLMLGEDEMSEQLQLLKDVQHMTIISGYDDTNNSYQLTELKSIEPYSRFLNWYPAEVIAKVVGAENLSFPNTWFEFRFSSRAFDVNPDECLHFLNWNYARFNVKTIYNNLYCGLKGIEEFYRELMDLDCKDAETRNNIFNQWYHQLTNVLQQRIAYCDFLRIAAFRTGLDFDEKIHMLMDVVKHWILVRKFCYKLCRKEDRRIYDKLNVVLNKILVEEPKLFSRVA